MKRILERLFDGKISPSEHYYDIIKDLKERQEYDTMHRAFEERLKMHGLLDEYELLGEAEDKVNAKLESAIFIGGFQLGARIILEALMDQSVF